MSAQPAHIDQLNGAEKQALSDRLDRDGAVPVATGIQVRPLSLIEAQRAKRGRPPGTCRRAEPEGDALSVPSLAGMFSAEQSSALRVAGEAFAAAHVSQQEADLRALTARYSVDPTVRVTALELEQLARSSKQQFSGARAGLRLAILDALEAEAKKAGAAYRAACDATAFAAGKLHALGSMRDELLNVAEFDPMGLFGRSFLLAPPERYRPLGWATVSDCWGRACYFDGQSAGHADLVRKEKADFRAALQSAMGDAPWPFDH
ncbi:hypothetical protein [Mitsuaria sp. GD03876]|uniref:hypothetical protein n=1 Tax=Mitsuaria sp. GD03876 TaxID=2975399 RepID=UPI00244D6A98|nr:hypothetical protein [Mitsuaria sp. GD03876]MDH0866613.1 hypothetical protein [Mitsuaria sp. GD03876]